MVEKILSVVGTVGKKLPDLPIKDAQLIFVKDKCKIALDLNGKRTFYNEIITFETEQERVELLAPISGCFYFVINTAVLWFYKDTWVQITTPPEEILFIGTELPELGSDNKLYINKEKRNISVWDENGNGYITVGEVTGRISNAEIDKLFNQGE